MSNSKRYLELDIAKGLAVFFMILVHTQDSFAAAALKEGWLGRIIDVLGGVPAAPVFMFLMGAGVAFSSASPAKLAKRGLILLILAWLLNLARGGIPYGLAGWLYHNPQSLYKGLQQSFFIDILHFAGLSMLIFAGVRHLRPRLWIYFAITLMAGLLNEWLQVTGYLQGAWWASLFYGSTELSFFPLLSWIAYPSLGMIYGSLLLKTPDKGMFHCWAAALAVLTVIIGGLFFSPAIWRDLGYWGEYGYYHHGLIGNIVFSALIMIWIAAIFSVDKYLGQKSVGAMQFMSVNVNSIYIVHWILIGWLCAFTNFKIESELVLLLLIGGITALSALAVHKKLIPKLV